MFITIEAAQEAARAIDEHMAAWPDMHGAREAEAMFRRARVTGLVAISGVVYGESSRVWVPQFSEALPLPLAFVIEAGHAYVYCEMFFDKEKLFSSGEQATTSIASIASQEAIDAPIPVRRTYFPAEREEGGGA